MNLNQCLLFGRRCGTRALQRLDSSKNQGPQGPLLKTFCQRVNRRDPAHMDLFFATIPFENLEFGMIEINAIPYFLGPSIDDDFLPRRQHLLNVEKVKPAADNPPSQRHAYFLERSLDDLASTEKPAGNSLNKSPQTNCFFGCASREPLKLSPIFVSPRIVLQQIAPGNDLQPSKQPYEFRIGNPWKRVERLIEETHRVGVWVRVWEFANEV